MYMYDNIRNAYAYLYVVIFGSLVKVKNVLEIQSVTKNSFKFFLKEILLQNMSTLCHEFICYETT